MSDMDNMILSAAWLFPIQAGVAFAVWRWKAKKSERPIINHMVLALKILVIISGIFAAFAALIGLSLVVVTESSVLSGLVASTMVVSFCGGKYSLELILRVLRKIGRKDPPIVSDHGGSPD